MRMYRIAEGLNTDGLPFFFEGNAYLADGTPLTEYDPSGRIVPALATMVAKKATCSGGLMVLAERQRGIEAPARALEAQDFVRAPLVLLHLQIDPTDSVGKYNPFHKPDGPGAGQFASDPAAGSQSTKPAGFQEVGQSLNVGVNSTYVNGINGPEMDKAHAQALALVRMATFIVGKLNFKPGMPTYGQVLDLALQNLIEDLHDPNFHVKPVYLMGELLPGAVGPLGSSVPDLVYGPKAKPLMIFDLKTGRAAKNINDAEIVEQKRKTLLNAPGDPIYQYFQVYEQ